MDLESAWYSLRPVVALLVGVVALLGAIRHHRTPTERSRRARNRQAELRELHDEMRAKRERVQAIVEDYSSKIHVRCFNATYRVRAKFKSRLDEELAKISFLSRFSFDHEKMIRDIFIPELTTSYSETIDKMKVQLASRITSAIDSEVGNTEPGSADKLPQYGTSGWTKFSKEVFEALGVGLGAGIGYNVIGFGVAPPLLAVGGILQLWRIYSSYASDEDIKAKVMPEAESITRSLFIGEGLPGQDGEIVQSAEDILTAYTAALHEQVSASLAADESARLAAIHNAFNEGTRDLEAWA